MNADRVEDLVRIAAGALNADFDQIEARISWATVAALAAYPTDFCPLQAAEIMWVDVYGAYMRVLAGGDLRVVRVPFPRTVRDERDCRSMLTMMAQAAWENTAKYSPVRALPLPCLTSPCAAKLWIMRAGV